MQGVRNREIKSAKKQYYPDKVHHLKQANRSQWFYRVKLLCGLQKLSTSLPCPSHLPSETAAQEINGHFTSICQTLLPLSTASLPAYIPSPSTPHAVHEANVVSRIRIFKCNNVTEALPQRTFPSKFIKILLYNSPLPSVLLSMLPSHNVQFLVTGKFHMSLQSKNNRPSVIH